jgi:outer membrane protein OmpA-like peptidoglycan-associated protein
MLSIGLGLSLLASAHAAAQTDPVHLDQYRPAPSVDDGFAISRPDDRGHLLFGARLDLDYALNPLVAERTVGDATTEEGSVVEHQLAAHLNLSLGLFDRLVIFAGLPVNLVQSGAAFGPLPGGDGAGLGDVFVGARGRLAGEPSDVFALGLQLLATFPTAIVADDGQRYSGERGVTVHPSVLLELRPTQWLRVTGNVGARFRTESPATVGNLTVGHELTFGVGLTAEAVEDLLSLYLEGWGSSTFETFGQSGAREATPFEALLGVRIQAFEGFEIGAGGGTGLSRGYGTPDFRGVFTIGYAQRPIREATEEAPPVVGDRDHDGIDDDNDQCPNEPEDMDGVEDTDGCPDPDNDDDGVLDGDDQCPSQPEDRDEFEDDDGCPDPDNDGDGVLDGDDGCPMEPEDRDGFEDEDGCPDLDNDQDSIPDLEDQCPMEPGVPEEHGCPRTVRVDHETGQIQILQRVEFATNRDVILPESMPVLEDVRGVLAVNRAILVVRVEGHTDDRGRDTANMDLSARRARSVARWLVEHGIDGSRLRAFGCGEGHPIEPNRTRAGRQSNRRVEFHILEPVPPHGVRALEGCTELAVDAE